MSSVIDDTVFKILVKVCVRGLTDIDIEFLQKGRGMSGHTKNYKNLTAR